LRIAILRMPAVPDSSWPPRARVRHRAPARLANRGERTLRAGTARDPRPGPRSEDGQAIEGASSSQQTVAAAGSQRYPGARGDHPYHGRGAPAVRDVASAPGRTVVL